MLADRDDLQQLGRIAVEIDHVAGLARRHRAGLHRDSDIGLSQRRRIVGAVAAHRDKPAARLFVADQLQLVFGRRLRQEIVDPRLGRDRRGGQRIVARDHHSADAGAAKLGEALADAALDDVFQMDDAKQPAIQGDGERRPALLGDAIGDLGQLARRRRDGGRRNGRRPATAGAQPNGRGAAALDMREDSVDRPLPNRGALEVDAADARLGRKCYEAGIKRRHVAAADGVFLLREDDD